MRSVRANDEHARRRVHRGDDAESGRRPADPVERLVSDLALDERDVEPPGLEQRHVLGAALGVALLDRKGGIDLVNRVGHRRTVDGKSAAGRRGAQDYRRLALRRDACRRRHGGYPITSARYTRRSRTTTTNRGAR